MSEFGGLRKHEKTQHALNSSRIISLFIVATIMEEEKEKNKMVKTYKHLQSQGQDPAQKWPTAVSGLMLIACLDVEMIQR